MAVGQLFSCEGRVQEEPILHGVRRPVGRPGTATYAKRRPNMFHASTLLVVAYVSVLVAIASYGFHRYVLLYLYLKHKHNAYQIKGRFIQMPRITVQLPMYNEGA